MHAAGYRGPRVGDTVKIEVQGKVMRVLDDGQVEVEVEHGPRVLPAEAVVVVPPMSGE